MAKSLSIVLSQAIYKLEGKSKLYHTWYNIIYDVLKIPLNTLAYRINSFKVYINIVTSSFLYNSSRIDNWRYRFFNHKTTNSFYSSAAFQATRFWNTYVDYQNFEAIFCIPFSICLRLVAVPSLPPRWRGREYLTFRNFSRIPCCTVFSFREH